MIVPASPTVVRLCWRVASASLALALFVAAGIAIASGVWAPGRAPISAAAGTVEGSTVEASRSLLLFTWDTTRADRIGAYGHRAARTPGFDGLAARGVVYERAYAAAPVTLPSHTTILTGVYPCAHGVRDNALFEVGGGAKLLSEVLHDSGFRTGAFVATFILDAKFGLAQGFDVYQAPDPSRDGLGWSPIELDASQVTEGALRFIDTLKPGERFFLWVHYYDPHAPHHSMPGERQDGQDDYDAEIARCDAHSRHILERLHSRGLDDGLLTVITADHGESHDEHGEPAHGHFVYDSTMRVPLALAPAPSGTLPGSRIADPVSTADIAGTVLERLGVGRETLPEARTPPLPTANADGGDRVIYLEAMTPYFAHRWHGLRSVVWNGFKYVEAPRRELYRVGSDETENLFDAEPAIAQRLTARLAAFVAEHPPLDWQAQYDRSSEDTAALAALGYAAAGAVGGDPIDPSLPDPKDRIGDIAKLGRVAEKQFDATRLLKLDVALRTGRRPPVSAADQAQGEARLDEALGLLAEIRTANPGDPFLDQIESQIVMHLNRYAEAVPVIERALQRAPRNMPLRYNLAVAYVKTERVAQGVREMEKAVVVEPRSLPGHRWLVQMTMNLRDWPATAWWLDELAKLPGQSAGERDGIRKARERVTQELTKSGTVPRAPVPVSAAELAPGGGS